MQSMGELLGIVNKHFCNGADIHIDFYNSDLFSISIYDIKGFRIDEQREYLIVNDEYMFNYADCKNPQIKNIDDGILVSANIENATLDIVIHNRSIG
jgi:hypothetical protein